MTRATISSSRYPRISSRSTIDRTLAHYGPDAKDVRSALRSTVAAGIERIWPTTGARLAGFDLTISPVEALYDKIEELSPQTESQRALRTQALQAVPEIGRLRFLFFEQAGMSIPVPFLVVMVFWLTI